MAGSLNKVQLIGNLGRDPEVRTTKTGDPVVHLALATGESWKDKATGERKEKTEWHRVVIWNTHLGDIAKQYLRKGSKRRVDDARRQRGSRTHRGVRHASIVTRCHVCAGDARA